MDYKDRRLDYMETLSEEISLYLGLSAKVVDNSIKVGTIAGEMNYKIAFYGEVMKDVYRFIYLYGMKLSYYGITQNLITN